MTAPFPDHPFLSGNFAPIRMEADVPDLIVKGEVPAGLEGALYRIGPDPQFPPFGRRHHWFLGDGMVHGFFIAGGRVSYRNRWVRTAQFEAERAAGRRLVTSSFEEPSPKENEHLGPHVANTNIVMHGGRLFALEEGNPPVEMTPRDLATRGRETFGGRWAMPFTAHPKHDPATDELLFFGYFAKGAGTRDIAYGVLDGEGRLTRAERFKAPYAAMVHDFAITHEHALFPLFPATFSLERIMAGGPPLAWEPEAGVRIGVLPRGDGIEALRWFEAETCFVYHTLNAWSEGTRIIMDGVRYARTPLFPAADGSPPPRPSENPGQLARFTIDLAANTDAVHTEILDERSTEFPRFDERVSGRRHRHAWLAATLKPDEAPTSDAIAHVDLETGRRQVWAPGPGDYVMEPVFAPLREDAPEGDGVVMTIVYRGAEHRSDLVILDAQNVAAGPLAVAQLPHRVPFGFHGNWVAA